MDDIKVIVKPVFKVIDGGEFDEVLHYNITGRTERALYCYNCGSPLFYMEETSETDEESKFKYTSSVDYFCAVCGRAQGGYSFPNPFTEGPEEEEK